MDSASTSHEFSRGDAQIGGQSRRRVLLLGQPHRPLLLAVMVRSSYVWLVGLAGCEALWQEQSISGRSRLVKWSFKLQHQRQSRRKLCNQGPRRWSTGKVATHDKAHACLLQQTANCTRALRQVCICILMSAAVQMCASVQRQTCASYGASHDPCY